MWRKRPLVLAVTNSGKRPRSICATFRYRRAGVDLVRNGDFAQGGARWNFAADDHLPWHIFNLWVELLFEQGVLGIVAFALAIGVAVAHVARAAASGDWFDAAVFAAIIGFLTIGFSESLLDGPRIATLFFLVVIAAFVRRTDGRRGAVRRLKLRIHSFRFCRKALIRLSDRRTKTSLAKSANRPLASQIESQIKASRPPIARSGRRGRPVRKITVRPALRRSAANCNAQPVPLVADWRFDIYVWVDLRNIPLLTAGSGGQDAFGDDQFGVGHVNCCRIRFTREWNPLFNEHSTKGSDNSLIRVT